VLDLIQQLRGQVTVFLSTHILGDAERVCDIVGIIHQGHLVTVAAPRRACPAVFDKRSGAGARSGQSWEATPALVADLERLPWVTGVTHDGARLRVAVGDPAPARQALAAASGEQGCRPQPLRVGKAHPGRNLPRNQHMRAAAVLPLTMTTLAYTIPFCSWWPCRCSWPLGCGGAFSALVALLPGYCHLPALTGIHLPLNNWLGDLGLLTEELEGRALVSNVIILGLTAGLSEELVRAAGYGCWPGAGSASPAGPVRSCSASGTAGSKQCSSPSYGGQRRFSGSPAGYRPVSACR
jgi:hypothetical protein